MKAADMTTQPDALPPVFDDDDHVIESNGLDDTEQRPAYDETIALHEALLGVLARPRATFEKMRDVKQAHWWLVAVIALAAVVLGSVAAAFTNPGLMSAGTTGSQVVQFDGAIQPGPSGTAMSSMAILGGIVGGIVGLAFWYLIRAGLLFMAALALGGRTEFRQIWRMAVWTTLPETLGSIVSGIAMLVTRNPAAPGLSNVLTPAEAAEMPVLAAFLGTINLYYIWSLLLIAIGLAATARLGRGKSLAVTAAYWALTIGATVGLAAIGAAFMASFN